ncbi:MAG: BolA/IbaG family iron-sulfur metabolism protein [Pelagibacteraceae bacterium]
MKNFLKTLEKKIKKNLSIEKINIIDNSDKHKKHKSFIKDKFHLCLEIESNYLNSLSRLEAQRKVLRVINIEMQTKIHALEIKIK